MVFFFWGTFDRGKWSGGAALKSKLRKGGIIKANEDFVTICPNKRLRARLNLPEKNLHQVKVGNEAELSLASADDSKMPTSIKAISKSPVMPGTFDLSADILLPKGFIPPVPGLSMHTRMRNILQRRCDHPTLFGNSY